MKLFKKYLVFIAGLISFGFGVSLCIRSGFGNNPMGVFVVGVCKHIALTVGTCNMIVALIEAGIGFLSERKNVTLATFICVVFGSYSIDVGNMIFPETTVMSVRVIYMLMGVVLYCLGFSIQQVAKCGLSHYDCFIFGLGKVFKVSNYALVRWAIDFLFIVVGYLLGGTVGIGTVILVFFSGKLVLFFKSCILKVFDSKW